MNDKQKKLNTKQFSDVKYSAIRNILYMRGGDDKDITHQVLADDVDKMIDRMKSGDNSDILMVLASSLLTLQMFNEKIAKNLTGDAGKKLDDFETLALLQLKAMAEQRKTIITINEVTNPKRTTFIKEVAQHNHIHQNSEKKEENENELQKAITHTETVTDAEVFHAKEKVT
jgi:hypothetical protein